VLIQRRKEVNELREYKLTVVSDIMINVPVRAFPFCLLLKIISV